ncbi:MAG: dihydrofolate reductase family protein, partial [Glutamicibacter arilaitensis]
RADFPWNNSHYLIGNLRTSVQELIERVPDGVLLGSGQLATALDQLGLIDEYRFLVHPIIAGHGPRLYDAGLPASRRLELGETMSLGNGVIAAHYRRAQ